MGVNSDDYTVTIGKNGTCKINSIQENVIICKTPTVQPEPDRSRSGEYPLVYVSTLIRLTSVQISLRLIACYTMVCSEAGVAQRSYSGNHYSLASEGACKRRFALSSMPDKTPKTPFLHNVFKFLLIQVHYGIHSTYVGSLKYVTEEDRTKEVILGAALGCAAVLLLCATVIGYLVYRRKAKVIIAELMKAHTIQKSCQNVKFAFRFKVYAYSSEVQNRGISGPTKKTHVYAYCLVLQRLRPKKVSINFTSCFESPVLKEIV